MTAREARRHVAKLAKNPEARKRLRLYLDKLEAQKLSRAKRVAKQQGAAHKRALLRGSKLALKKHKKPGDAATLVNHAKQCLA